MTDETTPKRRRGQKDREAAYRAGYLDGYNQGALDEATRTTMERAQHEVRARQMEAGLAKLRAEPPVKRTRRKKSNGLDAGGPASSAADPQ
jgi:hypothetical protein